MTTQHTPGPWIYEKNPLTTHTFNILSDGLRLAEVVSGPAEFTKPAYGCPEFIGTQGEANARLIAAAPELLEALEYSVSEIAAFYAAAKEGRIDTVITIGQFGRLEKAFAAIAKARGES